MVYYEATGGRLNLLINGHLIGHADQPRQRVFSINITQRVLFGEENLIELASNSGSDEKSVTRVEIRYYDVGSYP